jgi:hypothetical protein
MFFQDAEHGFDHSLAAMVFRGLTKTYTRSPGSRACCFSACAGSQTTQDQTSHSRFAWLSCCLPPLGIESASCSIGFSKLNSPAHRYLYLRFKRNLAVSPARLEARMDSLFPFLYGSFIPYNMPVYPGALRLADDPGVDRFGQHKRVCRYLCGENLR